MSGKGKNEKSWAECGRAELGRVGPPGLVKDFAQGSKQSLNDFKQRNDMGTLNFEKMAVAAA